MSIQVKLECEICLVTVPCLASVWVNCQVGESFGCLESPANRGNHQSIFHCIRSHPCRCSLHIIFMAPLAPRHVSLARVIWYICCRKEIFFAQVLYTVRFCCLPFGRHCSFAQCIVLWPWIYSFGSIISFNFVSCRRVGTTRIGCIAQPSVGGTLSICARVQPCLSYLCMPHPPFWAPACGLPMGGGGGEGRCTRRPSRGEKGGFGGKLVF